MDIRIVQSLTASQPLVMLNVGDYQSKSQNQFGISHFYRFKGKLQNTHELYAVPDGAVDLVFGLGELAIVSSIGGTVLKAKEWDLPTNCVCFGVRFQPGSHILPKDICIQDVVNADIDISDNQFTKKLSNNLEPWMDLDTLSAIFMDNYREFFLERQGANHELERYIRKRIYQCNGNITIKDLSKETGYSECYIRRVFGQLHGISPKVFEKFVRFHYVMEELNNKDNAMQLDEIALTYGYYDQAHMLKEFKKFTNVTPEAYRRMIRGSIVQSEEV